LIEIAHPIIATSTPIIYPNGTYILKASIPRICRIPPVLVNNTEWEMSVIVDDMV
jgi:hypothetical protein